MISTITSGILWGAAFGAGAMLAVYMVGVGLTYLHAGGMIRPPQ